MNKKTAPCCGLFTANKNDFYHPDQTGKVTDIKPSLCMWISVRTDYGVQGEWTLSEHLFVARHGRAFLTGFPVQVSQHHVDLRTEKTPNRITTILDNTPQKH